MSKSPTNLSLLVAIITEFRMTDNYFVCTTANTTSVCTYKVIHGSFNDNDEFTAVFPLARN